MSVLIVQSRLELGKIWCSHLERAGHAVTLVAGQTTATDWLADNAVDIIILDLVLEEGSALAVADYASYRQPGARVIFVTSSTFFSDGSIFAHSANARAFMPADTAPEDLAALVDHYGNERPSPA